MDQAGAGILRGLFENYGRRAGGQALRLRGWLCNAGQEAGPEMMRGAEEGARREDALRRLAQLAFGQANDAVKLALAPREARPEELDLSAVAELKVTDKGGVEVKLVDRVRALGTLCELLGEGGTDAESLYRALEDAAGQLGICPSPPNSCGS